VISFSVQSKTTWNPNAWLGGILHASAPTESAADLNTTNHVPISEYTIFHAPWYLGSDNMKQKQLHNIAVRIRFKCTSVDQSWRTCRNPIRITVRGSDSIRTSRIVTIRTPSLVTGYRPRCRMWQSSKYTEIGPKVACLAFFRAISVIWAQIPWAKAHKYSSNLSKKGLKTGQCLDRDSVSTKFLQPKSSFSGFSRQIDRPQVTEAAGLNPSVQ
jgi:hypothetical protein